MRLAVLVLALAAVCPAHDLVVEIETGRRAVVARASYDGADPAGRADFEIYAPGNATSPYQTGVTDPSGQFAFVPSTPGAWRVVVDDGFGHRAESAAHWSGDASAVSGASGGPPSRWRDALTGVSLIFGLVGLYLWRQASAGAPPGRV